MPEPVLLKDCKVWLGGYDLTGTLNRATIAAAKAEEPNGRFGDEGVVVSHGLQRISADLAGFWSAGTGEPDAVLFPSRLDPAITPATWPLTMSPPNSPSAGTGIEGNLAYTIHGREFTYVQGAEHGKNLPYSFKTLPSSGKGATNEGNATLYRGILARAKAQVSATTNGTAFQIGALGSSQFLFVALHVFAITGGSWVLTIESDATSAFSGAQTVRVTFSAVTTAPNRAMAFLVGPVTDTWWRTVMTKTGGTNLTYAVAFGIANL